MNDLNSFWLSQNSEAFFPNKAKGKEIYSYRVSSSPVRKQCNLRVKAEKKAFSRLKSPKPLNLPYLYTPSNKNYVYNKPGKSATNELYYNEIITSKTK